MIDLKKLIEAGVHFGHKQSRWHPKMAPYIWGTRDNIHLIDVSKTAYQLEKAAQFLESVVSEGKCILWVGTKKAAQEHVANIAQKLGYPSVTHRWIGGTLTNHSQVKKSITKLLHLEDVVSKSEQSHYTKKELVTMQKAVDRLKKNVGSIKNITWPIGAVVLVDIKKEATALREALSENIPVVGFVDTNCDPSGVTYVIPANDDASGAIELLLSYFVEPIERGQQEAKKEAKEKKKPEMSAAEEAVSFTEEEIEEDEETGTGEKRVMVKKMKTKEPVKPKKGPHQIRPLKK
jgi:small subunit ribosomal protein S2